MNKRFEGHKLGSIRVLARPGRTTPDQQWRLNGLRVCNIRLLSWICTAVHSQVAALVQLQIMTYMALMALRETTEDLTEFTSGRCRYD